MVVTVFIRGLSGDIFEINLCDTEDQFKNITVEELRRRIAEREGIPDDQTLLIFNGTHLKDGRRLSDCGVEHESTIHVTVRLRGGGQVDEQETGGEEDEAGGMGDRDGRNASMDRLTDFRCRLQ
ncbi:Ubiquitin-60S ribosomal protein L40 [Nibea albiflora]|uniref:Ubiquitin-60S ribosomal protein L40 n=1 Tax=Nibea albiflora TaxID=240163 RepID=A0ACB7EVD9_NIBAL|nr:Ubiquitin-60S ribosomal protein L40 [Nibea albiflora]